ncbi:MAG: hypothetical protein QXL17_01475 [Candidatus Thermoplasmatota archaeon]
MNQNPEHQNQQPQSYTTQDVLNNVNKVFKLAEQEQWNPAIFLHTLIFTSEVVMKQYQFVPKEIAEIRRQTKKIIDHIVEQSPKTTQANKEVH